MAKKTDFVDRPAPVVSSFSHGKRYHNYLSDADNMLRHKNYVTYPTISWKYFLYPSSVSDCKIYEKHATFHIL